MSHRREHVLSLATGLFALAAAAGLAADEGLRERELASKAFRAAVERALPSMVVIETHGGVTPAPAPARAPGPRRRRSIGPVAKPGEGPTTGLIVSPDGHILTSTFNFLHKPPVITVTLHDGSRHLATLLGRDDTRKLCLLKVDGVRELPAPVVAPRDQLKVGQWAISAGFGYGGDEPAIAAGIISAVSRIFDRAVQTDANTSPANYGGPLVDIEGRVIGVCVPMSPQGQGVADGVAWYDSGIGFAVPLDGLGPILAQLKAGKVIQPAHLGIRPAPQPPKDGGVAVHAVEKGSAAEKAGIQPKDIIVAMDDEPVADLLALRRLLGRRVAGDAVSVKVKRGDETLVLRVELCPPPAAGQQPQPRPQPVPPKGPAPAPPREEPDA